MVDDHDILWLTQLDSEKEKIGSSILGQMV